MTNRAKATSSPASLGVVVEGNGVEFLPELDEKSEIYHVQEYGGKGTSYVDMLDRKMGKTEVDSEDKKEIEKILDFIVPLHKTRHPSTSKKKLVAVYNDSWRNVIGHPEYLLQLLHDLPDDTKVLNPKEQRELLVLMFDNIRHFKNRPDRLSAIHGDFWGSNVFFRDDGTVYVIDYSRTPWGDPGYDVGIWMSQYLFRYHLGNKRYFKSLGNYFLNRYIERTGDKEIVRTMVNTLGPVAAIYASPTYIPGLDDKVRRSFYDHVTEILKRKEFFWD
jgi:thiamine kinase-like enzyme